MKKFINICGMITGIISVMLAFSVKNMDAGLYHVTSYTYGGDAYTGIQNAAAKTGNNVSGLAELVQFGFFALLLVFGFMCICYFTLKLAESSGNSANGNVNISVQNPVVPAVSEIPTITQEEAAVPETTENT